MTPDHRALVYRSRTKLANSMHEMHCSDWLRQLVGWSIGHFFGRKELLLAVEINRAFKPSRRAFAIAEHRAIDLQNLTRWRWDAKNPAMAQGQHVVGEERECLAGDVSDIKQRRLGLGLVGKELQRRPHAILAAAHLLAVDQRLGPGFEGRNSELHRGRERGRSVCKERVV